MKIQEKKVEIQPARTFKNPSIWTSIQEFLNDFFGSLIPGIYFSFFISISILSTILIICSIDSSNFIDNTVKLVNPFSVELFICFLIFSFVIGSVFYRKDPKEPDRLSAEYIYNKSSDKIGMAVQANSKEKKPQVDFPYLYIYEYLKDRGLNHLAKMIPWKGNDPSTYKYRTKMFINILKIRINYFVPEHNADIIKNEAHIRLISSLWFATKGIIAISIFNIIIILTAFIVQLVLDLDIEYDLLAICCLWNFLQIILFFFIRKSIIKFYHYQRVREIVYVLETAYLASFTYKNIFKL
ncbi:MAG: hypothetical protein EHM93_16930 [Bacteroidales bacterium]|nr:MAG: hypothetical protein EHM93_16930 [Bacteroidales bacterium]